MIKRVLACALFLAVAGVLIAAAFGAFFVDVVSSAANRHGLTGALLAFLFYSYGRWLLLIPAAGLLLAAWLARPWQRVALVLVAGLVLLVPGGASADDVMRAPSFRERCATRAFCGRWTPSCGRHTPASPGLRDALQLRRRRPMARREAPAVAR